MNPVSKQAEVPKAFYCEVQTDWEVRGGRTVEVMWGASAIFTKFGPFLSSNFFQIFLFLTEGKIFGRLRIPILGQKKGGKYGQTNNWATKKPGNLDKKSFDKNGPNKVRSYRATFFQIFLFLTEGKIFGRLRIPILGQKQNEENMEKQKNERTKTLVI